MSKSPLMHRHPKIHGYCGGHEFWFRACDDCGRRRFLGTLYECYPPIGDTFGWWYACSECVATDLFDESLNEITARERP